MIEVKVSRADFLRDKHKDCKNDHIGQVGDQKYYCCPPNIVKEDDLPEGWGLVYIDNGSVTLVKMAESTAVNRQSELTIICSIMCREEIKPQIFNYRKTKA